MRKLTLTADHFDTFVFQQVTTVPAENDSEFETGLRLLRKLKDPELTEEVPLTVAEQRSQEDGRKVFPFRKLLGEQADFVLQEDEYQLLQKRVKKHKTQVATLVYEEFAELLKVIDGAEKYDDKAVAAAVDAPQLVEGTEAEV